MVTIAIFGQGMQLPIIVKCDVYLDISEVMTITLVSDAIKDTLNDVVVAREKYAQVESIAILIEVVNSSGSFREYKPEYN